MLLSVNDLQLYLIISPFIVISKSNNQISFLDNKPGGNSLELIFELNNRNYFQYL